MALEEIDFINGQTPASAETMKALQQNTKNEFEYIAPVVLYENETGSTATITLNENVENFKYIKIFYQDIGENSRYSCSNVEVEDPNNKYVNAKIVAPAKQSANRLRIVLTTYYISDNTISPIDYLTVLHLNSETSYFAEQGIKITKVIGYR